MKRRILPAYYMRAITRESPPEIRASTEDAKTDRTARAAAERRYPIGAELTGNGVSFRVWAPSLVTIGLLIGAGTR